MEGEFSYLILREDIRECGNYYRGIKLMSFTVKILWRVDGRWKGEEVNINKVLFGLVKSLGTMNRITCMSTDGEL